MSEIKIQLGDITTLSCDCIVNAANESLLGGGGVDGAIHRAAGPALLRECETLGGCRTGEAKITKGYNLPAKYVIHTVGPVYYAHAQEDSEELLADCYANSLELARSYGVHSIAFPAISTGVYRFPIARAAEIATSVVRAWLTRFADYELTVIFCCFDERSYNAYKQNYADMPLVLRTLEELAEQALRIALKTDERIGLSWLQRYLSIGYNHAGDLIKYMEENGYVERCQECVRAGGGGRKVLLTSEEFREKFGEN